MRGVRSTGALSAQRFGMTRTSSGASYERFCCRKQRWQFDATLQRNPRVSCRLHSAPVGASEAARAGDGRRRHDDLLHGLEARLGSGYGEANGEAAAREDDARKDGALMPGESAATR